MQHIDVEQIISGELDVDQIISGELAHYIAPHLPLQTLAAIRLTSRACRAGYEQFFNKALAASKLLNAAMNHDLETLDGLYQTMQATYGKKTWKLLLTETVAKEAHNNNPRRFTSVVKYAVFAGDYTIVDAEKEKDEVRANTYLLNHILNWLSIEQLPYAIKQIRACMSIDTEDGKILAPFFQLLEEMRSYELTLQAKRGRKTSCKDFVQEANEMHAGSMKIGALQKPLSKFGLMWICQREQWLNSRSTAECNAPPRRPQVRTGADSFGDINMAELGESHVLFHRPTSNYATAVGVMIDVTELIPQILYMQHFVDTQLQHIKLLVDSLEAKVINSNCLKI